MVTGTENLFGEFMGTMVLLVFGCGVCANMTLTKSKGQGGGWICIGFGWAFAVTLGVFTATTLGAPQGDLNPAVTLAKMMAGYRYVLPDVRHLDDFLQTGWHARSGLWPLHRWYLDSGSWPFPGWPHGLCHEPRP